MKKTFRNYLMAVPVLLGLASCSVISDNPYGDLSGLTDEAM